MEREAGGALSRSSVAHGNYQLVTWDVDTTGRTTSDDIFHLAAYTPSSAFSQYIMPFKDINQAARVKHEISVLTIGRFRVLKDMINDVALKTKTERATLKEFVKWLESVKRGDGVILICHEGRKLASFLLLQSLRKYNLTDCFSSVVKGFVNSFSIAEETCSRSIKSLSVKFLAQIFLNREEPARDAASRAALVYDFLPYLFRGKDPDSPLGEEASVMIGVTAFVRSIAQEQEELSALQIIREREETLLPIFFPMYEHERYRAQHLQRLLAQAGIDYELLYTTHVRTGFTGMLELIESKFPDGKPKDLEAFEKILYSHFEGGSICRPKRSHAKSERYRIFTGNRRVDIQTSGSYHDIKKRQTHSTPVEINEYGVDPMQFENDWFDGGLSNCGNSWNPTITRHNSRFSYENGTDLFSQTQNYSSNLHSFFNVSALENIKDVRDNTSSLSDDTHKRFVSNIKRQRESSEESCANTKETKPYTTSINHMNETDSNASRVTGCEDISLPAGKSGEEYIKESVDSLSLGMCKETSRLSTYTNKKTTTEDGKKNVFTRKTDRILDAILKPFSVKEPCTAYEEMPTKKYAYSDLQESVMDGKKLAATITEEAVVLGENTNEDVYNNRVALCVGESAASAKEIKSILSVADADVQNIDQDMQQCETSSHTSQTSGRTGTVWRTSQKVVSPNEINLTGFTMKTTCINEEFASITCSDKFALGHEASMKVTKRVAAKFSAVKSEALSCTISSVSPGSKETAMYDRISQISEVCLPSKSLKVTEGLSESLPVKSSEFPLYTSSEDGLWNCLEKNLPLQDEPAKDFCSINREIEKLPGFLGCSSDKNKEETPHQDFNGTAMVHSNVSTTPNVIITLDEELDNTSESGFISRNKISNDIGKSFGEKNNEAVETLFGGCDVNCPSTEYQESSADIHKLNESQERALKESITIHQKEINYLSKQELSDRTVIQNGNCMQNVAQLHGKSGVDNLSQIGISSTETSLITPKSLEKDSNVSGINESSESSDNNFTKGTARNPLDEKVENIISEECIVSPVVEKNFKPSIKLSLTPKITSCTNNLASTASTSVSNVNSKSVRKNATSESDQMLLEQKLESANILKPVCNVSCNNKASISSKKSSSSFMFTPALGPEKKPQKVVKNQAHENVRSVRGGTSAFDQALQISKQGQTIEKKQNTSSKEILHTSARKSVRPSIKGQDHIRTNICIDKSSVSSVKESLKSNKQGQTSFKEALGSSVRKSMVSTQSQPSNKGNCSADTGTIILAGKQTVKLGNRGETVEKIGSVAVKEASIMTARNSRVSVTQILPRSRENSNCGSGTTSSVSKGRAKVNKQGVVEKKQKVTVKETSSTSIKISQGTVTNGHSQMRENNILNKGSPAFEPAKINKQSQTGEKNKTFPVKEASLTSTRKSQGPVIQNQSRRDGSSFVKETPFVGRKPAESNKCNQSDEKNRNISVKDVTVKSGRKSQGQVKQVSIPKDSNVKRTAVTTKGTFLEAMNQKELDMKNKTSGSDGEYNSCMKPFDTTKQTQPKEYESSTATTATANLH